MQCGVQGRAGRWNGEVNGLLCGWMEAAPGWGRGAEFSRGGGKRKTRHIAARSRGVPATSSHCAPRSTEYLHVSLSPLHTHPLTPSPASCVSQARPCGERVRVRLGCRRTSRASIPRRRVKHQMRAIIKNSRVLLPVRSLSLARHGWDLPRCRECEG